VPDDLRRWIDHQEGLAGEQALVTPRSALVCVRTGRRLEVRLAGDRTERVLLLRERKTAVRPEAGEGLGLSPREAEVLVWVARGKSNHEVAAILGSRPRTVGKHLERIYAKLGVSTRTEAAARVLDPSGVAEGVPVRPAPRSGGDQP
jgi:DNA-binding CsgD family transcriptional regulator